MRQLNLDKLFSLFDIQSQELYKQYDMEDVLDNPFVLMGEVVNGLSNYYMIDVIYQQKYPQLYKNVREKFKYKFFNRLVKTLERIDTTKFETIYTISSSYDSDEVYNCLSDLLIYFEDLEEYEKCKIIKDYMDHLLDTNFSKIYQSP